MLKISVYLNLCIMQNHVSFQRTREYGNIGEDSWQKVLEMSEHEDKHSPSKLPPLAGSNLIFKKVLTDI